MIKTNFRNSSGLLATFGGSSWFDVDGGIGSLRLPIPPSTSNGLRSAAGAEESDPTEELRTFSQTNLDNLPLIR